MTDKCESLDTLLKEQELVIRRHIKKHQFYHNKATIHEAINDFLDKYGWIMREIYCDASCSKSKDCEAYKNYLKNNKEIDFYEGKNGKI